MLYLVLAIASEMRRSYCHLEPSRRSEIFVDIADRVLCHHTSTWKPHMTCRPEIHGYSLKPIFAFEPGHDCDQPCAA